MEKCKIIWLTLFSILISCQTTARSEERISKMQTSPIYTQNIGGGRIFTGYAVSHEYFIKRPNVLRSPPTEQELNQISFLVYTKGEIDAQKIQTDMSFQYIQSIVSSIREDIRTLAASNDALIVRIQQLEERILELERR